MREEHRTLQHDEGLDQLRGLNLQGPDHQPATGAVHRAADHQSGGDQGHADQQGRGRQMQPAPHRVADRQQQQTPAGDQPDQLPLQVEGSIPHLAIRHEPAGRGEHQQPEAAPEGHQAEQQTGLRWPETPGQGQDAAPTSGDGVGVNRQGSGGGGHRGRRNGDDHRSIEPSAAPFVERSRGIGHVRQAPRLQPGQTPRPWWPPTR